MLCYIGVPKSDSMSLSDVIDDKISMFSYRFLPTYILHGRLAID